MLAAHKLTTNTVQFDLRYLIYPYQCTYLCFCLSVKEGNCIPWDVLTYNDEEEHYICQDSNDKENHFFWRKMKDRATMEENCFCLSDCLLSEYHQFDSFVPISDKCTYEEYDEVDWYKKLSE